MVSKGQISVGEFVAFYTYLGMLLNPIIQLSGLSTTISNGLVGATRIKELLDTIPEVKEAKNPLKLDEIKGSIVFDKVSFQYHEVAVVKNFSLEINPGQKIALVGPSGSGKSTIANLILRFYDVNTGKITVDGHDIRELQFESYRSRVGVVFQDPFLFSGTIKENIAYAKNDACEKDIMQAAKLANIEEFIHDLEKGYDTEIGENGVMISGGQKQRIAIARAILKNPRILILDEATSALDTISEYLVQDALDNLMCGRTTIIIAHRLSTIKNADLIVVMENGEIKQIGSHKVLLEQKGLYHDLYLKQETMQIKERN
jgi:subfamily B ATP-binding cassette protein MsbA